MQYINNILKVFNNNIITDKKNNIVAFNEGKELLINKFEDLRNIGKVIMIGNGGSAAIASHTANDFIRNAKIPAICISDYSVLTCLSNDYGYENAYKEAIKLLANKDDILVAISSSGNSQNIVNAVSESVSKGNFVLTLSGFSENNNLKKYGDINIYIPSSHYGEVELCHQIFLHMVTDLISERNI